MMTAETAVRGRNVVPKRNPVEGKRVQLMMTCLCDAFFDDAARAAIECLETAGCRVVCPGNQTCCGQAAYTSGDWETFRHIVRHVQTVFAEVARVLRPGGIYHMSCNNPYSAGVDERDWNGQGYPLKDRYVDGELFFADDHWEIGYDDGTSARVQGPREFRHTMSTLINGMAGHGFVLLRFWEDTGKDSTAEPGTWEHLKSIAPPFIGFWACYRPDVLQEIKPT